MTSKCSSLRGALRRIGGQIKHIEDVEGVFTATEFAGVHRTYGVLQTHDALVRIAFDARRVPRPPEEPCRLVVSGKVWLGERDSALTVMVHKYRVLEESVTSSAGEPVSGQQGAA